MKNLESLFAVKDRIAVITGGAGILAGTMAQGLAQAGAAVVLLDINEELLRQREKELQTISSNISAFKCDVLNEQNVQDVCNTVISKYQTIDILINAAGGNVASATIGTDQTVFDIPIQAYRKVLDLNLWGTIIPTLVFGKSMAYQGRGSIINISSMASFRAISRVMGYSVAKAAVDNFTRWMAVELAKKYGNGLRVNAIAPGFLITHQNRALLINEDGTPTERGRAVISMTPFGRFGNPEELIGTILWLASDASSFVTGTVIPVDGGFSIYSGV